MSTFFTLAPLLHSSQHPSACLGWLTYALSCSGVSGAILMSIPFEGRRYIRDGVLRFWLHVAAQILFFLFLLWVLKAES